MVITFIDKYSVTQSPSVCYLLSQIGCVPSALADIANDHLIGIIGNEKALFDQFDWVPETERQEIDRNRYDLLHIILLSPYCYEQGNIIEEIWKYISMDNEDDCVVCFYLQFTNTYSLG